MTVGNQILSHFFAQPMGRSHASQRIDFSIATPPAIPLESAIATAFLSSISSQLLDDPVTTELSNLKFSCESTADTASTISWAVSSDGFSTDVSNSSLP